MRPTHFVASLLALSTVTSAWPWRESIHDIKSLAQENGLYQKRQDNGGGDNNAPPPDSSAPPSSSNTNTASNTDSSASKTDSATSGSGTASGSSATSGASDSSAPPESDANSNSTTAAPPAYTDDIPLGAQPGGVNMIQPNTMSTATQYYKFDQTITWIWNYTSLSRAPSAIDIVATVSGQASQAAPSPFTLAMNYSFAPTETFTWDTGKYVNETSALPVGTYTLMIYDAGANGGVSATASAGYLAAFNQFRFGMYTGQPATSAATPFQCSTCNAAGSLETHILWTIGITGVVTLTSLLGFTLGWGVL